MRRILSFVLISFSLSAAGTAFGQWYENPGFRYSQDRYLFQQVRADLDRASRYPYASKADTKRFDEAKRDLFDFSSRFEMGRYERKELDHAIGRIESVVSHNSLDPKERGALDEDLRRMRDYRAFRDRR